MDRVSISLSSSSSSSSSTSSTTGSSSPRSDLGGSGLRDEIGSPISDVFDAVRVVSTSSEFEAGSSDSGGRRAPAIRGRRGRRSRSVAPVPTLQEPAILQEEQDLMMARCVNQLAVKESDEDATPKEALGISSQRDADMKTNYLRLKPRDDHAGVIEYRVTITPYIESVNLRRRLLGTGELEKNLGSAKRFDGEMLLLPFFLPHDMTFEASLKEDEGTLYKICVTFTRIRPVAECVDFFFDMMRLSMRWLNYKEIDGLFCDVNMRKTLDEHMVEVWPGVSLKGEINEDGMMIEVGTGSRFIGQDTVLDHLVKLKGDLSEMESKVDQLIVGMKVLTKYDYKSYLINKVAWNMAPVTIFSNDDEEISFKDYIERKHKVTIVNEGPPMLLAIGKRQDEIGIRYVTLVPECCHIIGLTDVIKGNERLMADLLESDKLLNAQLVENMDAFLNRILGDKDASRMFQIWGLHLERIVQ